MRPKDPPTARAARIASRQHGVVTAQQLLEAGVSRETIARWSAKGLLHREFRGVYRFGHRAPSTVARYLAAVLACGPGAVLSGLAAAHHYGLRRDPAGRIEVAVPADRRHPGIDTRRRALTPRVVTRWGGIPILTVPALVVELAATLPLEDLAGAAHVADVRHHVRPEPILRMAAGRPGAWKVRAVLDGDHQLVLSRLERHFVALLAAHGLPRAQTNRREGAHYVDCRWPAHPLTVELDSFKFHRTRAAWEQDRERERAARARGDEFRRYTWRDVVEEPAPTVRDLAGLLARGGTFGR